MGPGHRFVRVHGGGGVGYITSSSSLPSPLGADRGRSPLGFVSTESEYMLLPPQPGYTGYPMAGAPSYGQQGEHRPILSLKRWYPQSQDYSSYAQYYQCNTAPNMPEPPCPVFYNLTFTHFSQNRTEEVHHQSHLRRFISRYSAPRRLAVFLTSTPCFSYLFRTAFWSSRVFEMTFINQDTFLSHMLFEL